MIPSRFQRFPNLLNMQLLPVLIASASLVNAHYNFNALIYGGTTQATWQQGNYFISFSSYLNILQSESDPTRTAMGR